MNIVITGSTKGIGLAMAKEFLKLDDEVVISSRDPERVGDAVAELQGEFPGGRVHGMPADVSQSGQMDALAAFAVERMGHIDTWINNAGTTGYRNDALADCGDDLLRAVVETNLLGALYGCRAALRIMLPRREGNIFNMDGYGAGGNATPGMAAYGATKRAVPQLTKTLVKEIEGSGVGVHTLSPGMVLTDLLLKEATPDSKRIFNILAERPETVAQFLVPRVRDVEGSGSYIRFLTQPKIAARFATSWRRRNRFFDDEGRVIEGS